MEREGTETPERNAELASLARALGRRARRRAWLGIRRVAAAPPGAALIPAEPAPERVPPAPTRAADEGPLLAVSGTPEAPGRAAPTARPEAPPPTAAVAAACADLEALRGAVAGCTACDLCRTRTRTVFSDGDPGARVLFIGEAPGQNEDEQGVPFVGRAGRLLTDIVEKGMGLSRRQVYIANVLKCRPPENRDPTQDEKRLCTPFLDRQIELVAPDILITLGTHASQHVLGRQESMGRLRGRVHLRAGRKVVATYHPAFLLRSPQMKSECWKDIQLAMRELDLPLPGERSGS